MESVQTSKPCQVSEDLWMAQHLRYLLLLVRRTGGGQWAISCRVKSRGLKIGHSQDLLSSAGFFFWVCQCRSWGYFSSVSGRGWDVFFPCGTFIPAPSCWGINSSISSFRPTWSDFNKSRFNILPQMTLTQLDIALITLTVFVIYWVCYGQRQGRNLPPGPKKYPLIGNLLSMPSTLEWETFAKWGQKYSAWWDSWSSAQYSISALHRFRYCSCQCFREIDSYHKLVRSRDLPSRPKIQYLLKQVSRFKVPFSRRIYRNSISLRLDHILPCYTNCKF